MDRTSLISRNQTNIPLPGVLPKATLLRMPSMPNTASLSGLGATDSGLTPDTLVQRLPSIVNPDPVVANPPTCGNSFEEWVAANPMLAIIALGAGAYFLLRK